MNLLHYFTDLWSDVMHLFSVQTVDAANNLDFVKEANKIINDMSQRFATTIQIILGAFGTFAILLSILAAFYGKSLTDAKKEAKQEIIAQISKYVSEQIENEVAFAKRTFEREQIVSKSVVDYYLASTENQPNEYKLLDKRGFRKPVNFYNKTDLPKKRSKNFDLGDVFVIDVANVDIELSPEEKEQVSSKTENDRKKCQLNLENKKRDQIVRETIELISQNFPKLKDKKTVLVIYIKGISDAITEFKDLYIVGANSPISLIGNVTDSAYVAYGEKNK
ncbi:hypothetical protein [Merismopedia glauca]|uniref:Uncharacterized protein n=1 Tax=Merismopedia glauca CCAP 1448/3 TaxID=1296344 RepID=A0A2T1C057_9CYAN|nr:hypothetical protein [Merismopedia glauca]PSB01548.1 hypothetical protein C7B64_17775 [Merismopedia glauca CCAP 1448/3]